MKGGVISVIRKAEWQQHKNDPASFQNITNINDARNQTLIGQFYRQDTPPNLPEAIKWLTKGAEQKSTIAISSLIDIYETNGDTDKALYWLREAVYGFDKPANPIILKLGDTLVKSAVEVYTRVLKTATPNGIDSTRALKKLVGLTSMVNSCNDSCNDSDVHTSVVGYPYIR